MSPDVSFLYVVQDIEAVDAYDLIDQLNDRLEPKITFELVGRGNFGSGVFKDKLSAATGIAGAKYNGKDDDYEITVQLTKRAFTASRERFLDRLQQIVKHELIHADQTERAGKDLGASADGDQYFKDPHEIHAIVSEIETQLLQIEPDKTKLLSMIKRLDPKLEKSDRWRLYIHLVREQPKYLKGFQKVIKELILRLTSKPT